MKALVLAAGRGSRMRAARPDTRLDAAQVAAAHAGLKGMIPIHGRPFLDYVLHALSQAGFDDVALVVGVDHQAARDYYRALEPSRIRISFVTQSEPRGTADAVLAGKEWSDGEPFVTLNSDNLYPVDVLARLREAAGPAVPGFARDSLELPLDRLGAFALIERDSRGCLSRIVEKPGTPAVEAAGSAALISMNVWRFDARIFDACRDVPISKRGEKELPRAVGVAASRGVCFEVLPAVGPVPDLSNQDDIKDVERRLKDAPVRL